MDMRQGPKEPVDFTKYKSEFGRKNDTNDTHKPFSCNYKKGSKKYKKALFLYIFQRKACNVFATCEACNISRKTYYRWIKEDQAFADAVDDVKEGFLDWLEAKLVEHIQKGSLDALKYFLNAKGKKRGFGKGSEEDGNYHPLPLVAGD